MGWCIFFFFVQLFFFEIFVTNSLDSNVVTKNTIFSFYKLIFEHNFVVSSFFSQTRTYFVEKIGRTFYFLPTNQNPKLHFDSACRRHTSTNNIFTYLFIFCFRFPCDMHSFTVGIAQNTSLTRTNKK